MSQLLVKFWIQSSLNGTLSTEWFFAPTQEVVDRQFKIREDQVTNFNKSNGAMAFRSAFCEVYDETAQAGLTLGDLTSMPLSVLAVILAKLGTQEPVIAPFGPSVKVPIDFMEVSSVGTLTHEDRTSYYQVTMKDGSSRNVYEAGPGANAGVPVMKRDDFLLALYAAHNAKG